MLTDKELQSLRNMGNDAEAAADEIERLRSLLMQFGADLARSGKDAEQMVAAERERFAQKLADAEYIISAFERGADPQDYGRDIAAFRA